MKKFLLCLMIAAVCSLMQLSNETEEVKFEENTAECLAKSGDDVELEIVDEENLTGIYLSDDIDLEIVEQENTTGIFLADETKLSDFDSQKQTITY